MSNNDSNNQMAEAPASWNTRYVSPEGFECQLTLRAESGSELLEKVNSAIAYLLNNDCVPYTYNRGGYRAPTNVKSTNGNNADKDQSDDPAWCPIHQCQMKRWEKDSRVWYSHKVDDNWCKGK
ncbi:hypothetical protein ACFLY4_00760 [Chloroflexota bacterium]